MRSSSRASFWLVGWVISKLRSMKYLDRDRSRQFVGRGSSFTLAVRGRKYFTPKGRSRKVRVAPEG